MTDKQILSMARGLRRGILGRQRSVGMCAAVSAPLQGLLSFHGVRVELEEVDFPDTNHVFLRLPDGRILDPTADQFGLAPIYLGPLPEQYQEWMAAQKEGR